MFVCACGFEHRYENVGKRHLLGSRHYIKLNGGSDQDHYEINMLRNHIVKKTRVRDRNCEPSLNYKIINEEMKGMLAEYVKRAERYLKGYRSHEEFVLKTKKVLGMSET